MSDIDVHHLSAAYTLDALDAHEREAFEAHYESCEVCRADVLEFRETMAALAASLVTAPPAGLRDRVLAEVATTRQLSPSLPAVTAPAARRRPGLRFAVAAAAAVLLVVVGVVAVTGRDRDAYSDGLARLMEQPDVRMIDLQHMHDESGTFKVAWSPSLGQAALIGENLPPAPADKAYELWLITPEQSMAMYVLDTADGGEVHRMLPAPADPSAWAITMEPRSGSPVATGDIMYMAEVPQA